MSDAVRMAQDGETPVNPYSLLEAVNNSSDTAHTGWLIFLGLMAYLMIAIAGVTHKDLLLETPVALPIMQVSIQQAQFFQFAPLILVVLHIGVISQLVLLARKTLEFDAAVRSLETSERRSHPLRLELHNFFFVQGIAGPHRSAIMSAFLHAMSWLTLVILPVILILYIQIKFLPYHDAEITWTHRIVLVTDIAMLILIGVFLTRAETSFFQAFFRSSLQHPASFIITTIVLTGVTFFSFLVATIPGERLDGWLAKNPEVDDAQRQRTLAGGFSLPFLTPRADGSLFGLFHRNLIVTDLDLVVDDQARIGEASIVLRGRDLRYARLDRSDLHYADLTGTNLDGASLVGADLRGIRLQCADINELILTDNRESAKCASARGANFTRAKLSEARLQGVDLRAAKLEDSQMDGADLSYSMLAGANFSSAHLDRADLTGGVQMQGANFLVASLHGADMTGAQLQFADFSSASMQGAILAYAHLQGAVLRDADLEGADLSRTQLQGADMTGARVRATDLRGAGIWMTEPPSDAALSLALADMTELRIRPLDEGDVAGLKSAIDRIDNPRLQSRIRERLLGVMNIAESKRWAVAAEQQRWQSFVSQSRPALGETYGRDLSDHLNQMVCKQRWSSGGVATGVARRALGAQFRGNINAVYDRLRAEDCAATKAVPRRLMQSLSSAVETLRGN
jgi:uncharacterized protein YjbI with pentapeptide repeats